mmetsp:Transcript_146031/g.364125  ORF Transcript_146031/g.364125 Transcript_146031/m.364125 type:complete len:213 (-) Transcript_146031:7650-8288(-)
MKRSTRASRRRSSRRGGAHTAQGLGRIALCPDVVPILECSATPKTPPSPCAKPNVRRARIRWTRIRDPGAASAWAHGRPGGGTSAARRPGRTAGRLGFAAPRLARGVSRRTRHGRSAGSPAQRVRISTDQTGCRGIARRWAPQVWPWRRGCRRCVRSRQRTAAKPGVARSRVRSATRRMAIGRSAGPTAAVLGVASNSAAGRHRRPRCHRRI